MEALIVVDIQKDFCKGGALEVKNADDIIPVVNKLINKFQKQNKMIIATKDWHPETHKSFAVNSGGNVGECGFLNGLPQIWWPIHCVQNGSGSEFHDNLLPIKNIIYKGTDENIDSYSGFFDNGKLHKTKLDSVLKENKIETLYILGLATDYCVKFTVLDALDLGYKVYLIEDGCKGVNLNLNDSKNAIKEMISKGANIILSSDI